MNAQMPRLSKFLPHTSSVACIAACLMIGASVAATPALADTQSATPKIVVTGNGKHAIAPDMALFNLGVLRQAKTARKALDENTKAMSAILTALKEMGIAEKDLQTSGFSINPNIVYPRDSSSNKKVRILGYTVSNNLTVKIRDLKQLGTIIDQSVTLGANSDGNIRFSNSDPQATIDAARTKAMKDAIAKAGVLSSAAGVSLGKILLITEHSNRPTPRGFAADAAVSRSSAPVPIAAGENTYRVTVNVEFELKQ